MEEEKGSHGVTHKYLMRNTIAQENDIDINSIFVPKLAIMKTNLRSFPFPRNKRTVNPARGVAISFIRR